PSPENPRRPRVAPRRPAPPGAGAARRSRAALRRAAQAAREREIPLAQLRDHLQPAALPEDQPAAQAGALPHPARKPQGLRSRGRLVRDGGRAVVVLLSRSRSQEPGPPLGFLLALEEAAGPGRGRGRDGLAAAG